MEKWKWSYHVGHYIRKGVVGMLSRYEYGCGSRGNKINLYTSLNLAIF